MEEQTAAAVMKYLRCSNVNVFDFIRNAREFEKKRDIVFSKTLISGTDDRFKNSEDETTKVLKLKDVLGCREQSEAVLLAALSKLQRMVISVKVLKSTGVGISVNRLRNHASKQVSQISREVVKEWKSIVDEWLKANNENNMQQQIKVQNPPPPRSLVDVRIKLKKDDSKEVSTPVLGVSDETVKKVENICSYVETQTGIARSGSARDEKLGPQETCLKTERKIGSGNLIDYECDIFDESVEATGTGKSVRVLAEKHGSGLETSRNINQVHSGNFKKRVIGDAGDAIEEKFKSTVTNLKKSYLEDENMKKKRRIQLLSCEKQISLAVSRQEFKPPFKRQIRRRW